MALVTVTVNPVPVCTGNAVCSFVLYNSDTDMAIRALADGDTVSISADCSNDPTKCNIEAVVASPEGATQSVKLNLNGGSVRTESAFPYMLGGDTGAGADINRIPEPGLALGTSTVNAIPFSENSGGTAGTAGSVTFNVVP